jgi:ABC-type dipeptide/oligopeptide/nickel transport system permease component
MKEILDSEYIRTARAMGLPERIITLKYALKNALIPIVTAVGLQFGYALGGSIAIECVFRWPGLGSMMVQSILSRDLPVIQAALVFYAGTIAVLNIIIDIIYARIDPRIRIS